MIQQLYQHAPDARGFIMQYQLDTVLQDVVEQDESRLVQEQACVLLRDLAPTPEGPTSRPQLTSAWPEFAARCSNMRWIAMNCDRDWVKCVLGTIR